jgi:hypothetical protein
MGALANLLVTEGHCFQCGASNIRVAADYSAWLSINHLSVNDVSEDSISEYEQFRQQHRRPFLSDHSALIQLLRLLREINATTPLAKIVLEPIAQVEYDFEQYLRRNYDHCETSVIRHRTPLRKSLKLYGPPEFRILPV